MALQEKGVLSISTPSGPAPVRPPGVSEFRHRGLGGRPHPWLNRRRAHRPGTLRDTFLLQTGPDPASRPLGSPVPRGGTKAPRRPAARRPSPSHPGSSLGCGPGPRPPSPALLSGSSCARSGPGSAPAPQWPCSPITLMSAPLPLGFIGSQPALPG